MNVIRYQPWGTFDLMDRLLDAPGFRFAAAVDAADGPSSAWTPYVDVKEEAERFVIHADVTDVDPQDIEVSMEDGVLTLSGERKNEAREEGESWTRVERRSGKFLRRFTLPETADAEHVSAKGEHGVLEIVIPKLVKAQPRKIDVKVS